MQLSAELFSLIVQSLNTDERQSARHEQRKEGRVGIRCSVEVKTGAYDDKGQKAVRVTIRDLSHSGVGFLSHEHLDVGLAVGCRLPWQNGEWLQVKMTVRHCNKIASGLYNVGATFEKLDSTLVDGIRSTEPVEANSI